MWPYSTFYYHQVINYAKPCCQHRQKHLNQMSLISCFKTSLIQYILHIIKHTFHFISVHGSVQNVIKITSSPPPMVLFCHLCLLEVIYLLHLVAIKNISKYSLLLLFNNKAYTASANMILIVQGLTWLHETVNLYLQLHCQEYYCLIVNCPVIISFDSLALVPALFHWKILLIHLEENSLPSKGTKIKGKKLSINVQTCNKASSHNEFLLSLYQNKHDIFKVLIKHRGALNSHCTYCIKPES